MNERFEQMMLEATKDMPQGYYVPEEYFQKFAELIVQECVSLCKVETTVTDLPEYNIGIIEGYRRAKENMLGYFGVKNEPA